MPKYKAFLSCSIRQEDEPIVSMIELILERWGFEHHTVGRDTFKPEPISKTMADTIRQSDCLIAIATKRYVDENGVERTFEWLHGEVGTAYGMGKPIFILKDKSVKIEGLPPTVTSMVEFDSKNPLDILQPKTRQKIENYISNLKIEVEKRKSREFWGTIAKVAAGIGAIAAAAGAGYYLAKRKKNANNE